MAQVKFCDLEENNSDSKWSDLPDLLLERVFSYLTISEKYHASLVCRNWYRAFHLPYVWSHFVIEDDTLMTFKFNYNSSGWQYVVDYLGTQRYLTTVGQSLKNLTIRPMFNFYNLTVFMNMISSDSEYYEKTKRMVFGVWRNIISLKFTFPCNMSSRQNEERIRLSDIGLLRTLKRLIGSLKILQHLELIDLMLDSNEAQYLLDEVCSTCCMTLKSLYVINTTKAPYQLMHVGVFPNLYELYISPQNLGDDLIELLGCTNLKHLHIVQNRYTDTNLLPVSPGAWKNAKQNNKGLSVHLELESKKEKNIIWQVNAPVKSVLYASSRTPLRTDQILNAIEFYKHDLRIYGHLCIPRFNRSKSFHERIDGNLLMLVRNVTHLSTLIVTERISTATVLLLAYTGRNLKWLHIRRKAVMKKCDWTHNPDWSDEFCSWLKSNSISYDSVENEVSQILGYRWKFLTDKEFKRLEINLHDF